MAVKRFGYTFLDNSAKSQAVVERDLMMLSPSYTRSYGFVMARGEGAQLWDVDGNEFLDFPAGIAVMSTGYSHPRIVAAIKEQVDHFIHIGGTDFFYPQQINIAERLQRIIPINGAATPDQKRIFLSNSGAESIESAIKLARYSTKRPYLIAFYGGFHGRTMGALSITASKAIQREGYPYIPGGVAHIDYPNRKSDNPANSLDYLENVIFKKKFPPHEVAAIVVEPIQGEGGYIVPTDEFHADLRSICDKYGILLIADEIQSGIGRTGQWCAMEHWNVQPDIVCLAKGLGSGFPIGAIVAHDNTMGQWISGAHASTFGGNPLACEVAATTIDIIEDEGLLGHVTKLGAAAMERLEILQAESNRISRVDGKGFMIGIDFVNAEGKPDPEFRNTLVDECFLNGMITLGCGTAGLRLAPPLIMNESQFNLGLDTLERAIQKLDQG